MNDGMRRRLQAYYESRFPASEQPKVGEVNNVTGGWEHEMYAFDVERLVAADRRREALVLRIYSGDSAYERAEREFHGMKLLYDAGYPVPRVHVLERASTPVGKPFVIMESVDGQLLGRLVLDAPESKGQEFRALFIDLLVRLHSMDWRPFANYGVDYEALGPYAFADHYLVEAQDTLRHHSLPGFLPVVEWLRARRDAVPCVRPSVVHRDFHFNNILLRADGSSAVIDWTGLHVSDPRIDLAWTSLLVRTHVSVQRRDYLLQEYERRTGAKIEHLEWFEALACLWRLRDVLLVLSGRTEDLGFRAGTPTLIKQEMGAIRRVYDLLLERTAIRVPEVERLFASESGAIAST